MVTSFADVLGDWVYYGRILALSKEVADLERFMAPLFVFNIISTLMGVLLVTSLVKKGLGKGEDSHCVKAVGWFLSLEILLEDIPQFVMTKIIYDARGGEWTPTAIFNVTTSAFNFVFNLLDLATPDDDEEENAATEGQVYTNMEA
eukprot:CAMPEP_0195509382 /NCGR_PEP_ID=MMETSP0794_2-20130614/2332_1 /TAXON_ID=515487 /ORGANISM="Stephanopyxis turris, Strain CCMP 815" /LENGTH=145 /DNA_ID=CAMNT_0040636583 /DNA_START=209 /DNA_END=649 /DNA_ORIENTATION=-